MPPPSRVGTGALAASIALLLGAELADANVYSWKDDAGALHFTNMARHVPEVYRTVATSDGGLSEPEWKAGDESAESTVDESGVADGAAVPAEGDAEDGAETTGAALREAPALEAAARRRVSAGDAATAFSPERAARTAPAVRASRDSYADGVRDGLDAATDNVRAVGRVLERLLDRESRRQEKQLEEHRSSLAERERRVPILAERSSDEPRVVVRVVGHDRGEFVRYGALGPYAAGSPWCCSGGLAYGFAYGSFPPHSHFEPTPENLRRARLFFPDGHWSRGGFLFGHGYLAD